MKVYTKEALNNYDLSLTYDDISLIPQHVSHLRSRTEAITNCDFLGYKLALPVISSPMDTVTGIAMALELKNLGCLGVVNRFDSSLKEMIENEEEFNQIQAVSVSLTASDELLEKLAEKQVLVCIDTANANNIHVLDMCERIKAKYNFKVMVGNVASGVTLKNIVEAGADAIRVGIGGGSMCTTSIQTGIGIGQVSSVLDVYFARKKDNLNINIIADGGIKSPGDVAKAIAIGADSVMLGRMLSGTKETPGEVIKYNGQLWKKYRGSASFGVKMKGEFIEGEETMVPYKGTVKSVINSISDGLRSSMSYLNCDTLDQLRNTESFTILSNSSYIERLPKR